MNRWQIRAIPLGRFALVEAMSFQDAICIFAKYFGYNETTVIQWKHVGNGDKRRPITFRDVGHKTQSVC